MKTVKKIGQIVLIVITSITFSCKAQTIEENLTNLSTDIIGVWINEEDSNWSIEFTVDHKCHWYYSGDLTNTFSYSISITSPQCKQEVKTGGLEDFYLRLINYEDNDAYCYEILGVDGNTLSLSSIGLGVKNFYFNKQ
ncbi:hypothetical protein [uncultured Winogradskyella sp.]|uniref:hypothetical protein n=1 Tax=uncultured Winogradskyella sp. TaxID=395353 RepID=UPI00262A00FF|nr:hypothetical protein [uncultured Winogradskyella sp.]